MYFVFLNKFNVCPMSMISKADPNFVFIIIDWNLVEVGNKNASTIN